MSASTHTASLAAAGLLPPDTLAAGLVGSTARGWATSLSDVDVCVVVDQTPESADRLPVPLDPPWTGSVVRHLEGIRWELAYWTAGQVDQMLAKVSWNCFDKGLAPEGVIGVREEIFLSRVPEAMPLVGGPWWREAQERLSSSAFQAFQVGASLNSFDNAKLAALGQLERGDLECAVLSARRAFDFVTDALLESHGSFGSRLTKWKPKRYIAVEQSLLPWEECWAVLSLADLPALGAEAWVLRTVRRAQEVCRAIEVRRGPV